MWHYIIIYLTIAALCDWNKSFCLGKSDLVSAITFGHAFGIEAICLDKRSPWLHS